MQTTKEKKPIKKNDEIYTLTLAGLLSEHLPESELKVIMFNLELYMLKHDYNGILYDKDSFQFVKLVQKK
jgi:hypothetical protein